MTVATTNNKHIYDGNDATVYWPYTFNLIQASDIEIYITDEDGAVDGPLESGYDVEISNSRVKYPSDGSGLPTLPTGSTITILRKVDLTQDVTYTRKGPFDPNTVEQQFDKQIMISQQLQETLDRCVKYGVEQNPSATDTETFLSSIETARDDAAASAAAASLSEVAAAASEAAAAISETNAGNSETAAGVSETNALNSENAAALSETNAAASALAASGSASTASSAASTATTQANNAANSAAAALTSANNASTSETNAGLSETAALAAQGAAETAQGLAEAAQLASETAQGLSEAARDAAAISAAAALVSEGNAANSEVAAAISETNAGLSETAAGLSATAAGNAQTAAEAAQTAAETAQGLAEDAQTAAEAAAALLATGTFDNELTLKHIAEPTTPAAGYTKIFATADGIFKKTPAGVAEPLVGSGGGLDVIFTDNYDAGITDVSTTDGTNLAISHETTSPLVGNGSLKIVKAASDESGDYIILKTLSLEEIYDGQVLQTSFLYDLSDSNYVDEDLVPVAYAKEYSQEIAIIPEGLMGGKGRFLGQFQVPVRGGGGNEGEIEIRLKVGNANTNGYTGYVDNTQVFIPSKSYGATITEWNSCVMTSDFSGGSGITVTAFEKIIGDTAFYKGKISWTTAPTGGSCVLTIPRTIDTTKIESTTQGEFICGFASFLDNGGPDYPGTARYWTTNSIILRIMQDSVGDGSGYTINNSIAPSASRPVSFADTDSITFAFSIPVAGLGAPQLLSDVGDLRTTCFKANGYASTTFNSGVDTALVFSTVAFDTHAKYNASTGEYELPSTGYYIVKCGTYTGNQAWDRATHKLRIKLDDVTRAGTHWVEKNLSTGGMGAEAYIMYWELGEVIFGTKGQKLKITFNQSTGSNYSWSADTTQSHFSIAKVQGSTQVLASEKVVAIYSRGSALNLSSGSETRLDFDTKVKDTHNAVTTGASWSFAAPKTDDYWVTLTYRTASNTDFSPTEAIASVLYANGVSVEEIWCDFIGDASSSNSQSVNVTTLIPLNKGETFYATAFQNSGNTQALSANAKLNRIKIASNT